MENLPTIVDATLRREQRTLAPDTPKQEAEALFPVLNIGNVGTAYIQPLCVGDSVLAVLVAALPYQQGEFSHEQHALFDDIGRMASLILAWHYDAEAATLLTDEGALESILDSRARERAEFVAGNGGKVDELRNQLKLLKADHESLVNQREEMRRDYQDLLGRYAAREQDKRALQDRIQDLKSQLDRGGEKRNDLERHIAELSGERDNLLRIRDQLTARLADSSQRDTEAAAAAPLRRRLQELQDTVSALNEQREQLALELGDAKTALAAANLERAERAESSEGTPVASQLVALERSFELIQKMQGPVSAISASTEILLKESIGILGAAQHEVLQRVTVNLGRLTALLGDLMELGHNERDRYALSYAEIDIVNLLYETIAAFAADIRQKQLALELSVDDGLPKIRADADYIKRAMRHLLQNACDVSDEGAPIVITAALASTPSPANEQPLEAIRISVADRGGGIPAKDLPRVFARKYLHENPEIEGLSDTGVGMTVARAFARAHAGDLWIDSKAGEGSVFHLDLPTRLMPSAGE